MTGTPQDLARSAQADAFLARALREGAAWPPEADAALVVERLRYHGLAGALAGRLGDWPAPAAAAVRTQALAEAMRELRHREVLAGLLAAFAAAGLRALVLKGSALAYDLYDPPAARPRGDTDLLVAEADRDRARGVLAARGFVHFLGDPEADEDARLQETWLLDAGAGPAHQIDLHWRMLNAPTLARLLPFDRVWAKARPLPRLGPDAFGLPHGLALLLACAHRAQHIVIPYFVDGRIHHGGDRLIWLRDIDLLLRAMGPPDWAEFLDAVTEGGLAAVARDGLDSAAALLGAPVPPEVAARLAALPQDTPAARYLLASRQAGRAWSDLRAMPGLRGRLAYLWGRVLPPPAFMRGRYPKHAHRPLALLYLLRMAEFLAGGPAGRSR